MSDSYDQYRDIDNPYLEGKWRNDYPLYSNFWRNEPLQAETTIDPRRAGYRPYFTYYGTEQWPAFQDPCMVTQSSCDLILPVNKCYVKNPDEWIVEMFRGR